MATSIPTWANLGPVKIAEGPGQPIRVRISTGLGRIPTPAIDELEISPNKGFTSLLGFLCLVQEPHLGGTRWWLCGSWMLSQSTADWDSHELLLRESEPAECEFQGLSEPLKLSTRWADSRFHFLDFRVQHPHMKELIEHMGDPHGEGSQFFNRLLPGRLPCALRCTPHHWQIWIQL